MSSDFITAIVFSILAAVGTWVFADNKHAAEVAELRLAQIEAITTAAEQGQAYTQTIAKTYQGALNASRTREAALRRDIDGARAESDRLREQNADAARKLASAPAGAVLEYAYTVTELFDQCQRSYQGMAGIADGHAGDARTLIEAWPTIPAAN